MRQRRSRQTEILDALAEGEGDVERLAARFGVSPSTIRRDLAALSARQAVARTYGGAMLAPAPEASLQARAAEQGSAKAAIARQALGLIGAGETLILDGGSTVAALGRLLPDFCRQAGGPPLRVVTTSIPLVPLLAEVPGLELIVPGGTLRPISMSLVGPLTEQALRQITAARAFVSADGLLPDRGLCEATLEQASLKALMLHQAREVVVLADAGKLGRAEQPFWAALPPRWTLVTDAPAAACAPYARAGAQVIRAEA